MAQRTSQREWYDRNRERILAERKTERDQRRAPWSTRREQALAQIRARGPLCQCGCGQPAPLADCTDLRNGYIKGEPRRYARGHNSRGNRKPVRYLVQDCGYETPCWVWQLNVLEDTGYGLVWHEGGPVLAHRLFYEEANGPIHPEATLDHLCRNRACVNPAHLEPVTSAENCRRGINTKLTYDRVEMIRSLLARGTSPRAIAPDFDVSFTTIYDIKAGRTWAAPGGVLVAEGGD